MSKDIKTPKNMSLDDMKRVIEAKGRDVLGLPNAEAISVKHEKVKDRVFVGIFEKPSPKVLSLAMPFLEKNMHKLCDILVKHCWVDGDNEIKEDSALTLAAGSKIVEIWISGVEAELVNF